MGTAAGASAGAPRQGRAAVSRVGLLHHAAWELAWMELGLVWGSRHEAAPGAADLRQETSLVSYALITERVSHVWVLCYLIRGLSSPCSLFLRGDTSSDTNRASLTSYSTAYVHETCWQQTALRLSLLGQRRLDLATRAPAQMELCWARGGGSSRAGGVAKGAVPASREGRRRLVWLVQNLQGQRKLFLHKAKH